MLLAADWRSFVDHTTRTRRVSFNTQSSLSALSLGTGQALRQHEQDGMYEDSSRTESVYKDWQVLYPEYIMRSKTIAEGRRIPKEHCAENPTAQHMFEACKALGLRCELEVNRGCLCIIRRGCCPLLTCRFNTQ